MFRPFTMTISFSTNRKQLQLFSPPCHLGRLSNRETTTTKWRDVEWGICRKYVGQFLWDLCILNDAYIMYIYIYIDIIYIYILYFITYIICIQNILLFNMDNNSLSPIISSMLQTTSCLVKLDLSFFTYISLIEYIIEFFDMHDGDCNSSL